MSTFKREMNQDYEKLYSGEFHNLCILFNKHCLNKKQTQSVYYAWGKWENLKFVGKP